MTPPIQEPTTQRAVSGLGWGESQLARRPAPAPAAADPIIQYFQGSASNQSLGTSLTDLDFINISSFNDGTYIGVSGGDVRILQAGVYRFEWFTTGWTINAGVSTVIFGSVTVTSGTGGNWSGYFTPFAWSLIMRVAESGNTIDARPVTYAPDAAVTVAWSTAATFPVVIKTQMFKQEDGSGVSDTMSCRIAVTRLGMGYE